MTEGMPGSGNIAESKERHLEVLSVNWIVERLKHVTEGEIEEWPLRFELARPISAEELSLLPDLPVEVSIIREGESLILSTGVNGTAVHEWDQRTFREMIEGQISMHSHNGSAAAILHCPSVPDLRASMTRSEVLGSDFSKTAPMMIVTEKGILLYQLNDDAWIPVMFLEEELTKMQRGVYDLENPIDSMPPELAYQLGREVRSFLKALEDDNSPAVVWRDIRWEHKKTISPVLEFLNGEKTWEDVALDIFSHDRHLS